MAVLGPRRSLLHGAALAMGLGLGLGAAGACRAQVDEHALKAAFVYNIAAFTQWEAPASEALTICLQVDAQLEAAIAGLAGRQLAGRPVKVRWASPVTGCDVLVHDVDTPVLAAAGTLVICDACRLPDGASAVALVREGNRIRFDIDPARARDRGITLSSQLMKLARHVL
ncbi:YfiR family protein [Luteimonas kalidii]|uniref:YfiR family protein n=1 Tax=Luteimonas kalidii TaxID=3042025 RepID=A0ABT6JRG3_9GAMM|nr:YfiR family protein [Luteimonas kalidii]MDH5833269.1 YfiR family protein [Luteimonas kalidii]